MEMVSLVQVVNGNGVAARMSSEFKLKYLVF